MHEMSIATELCDQVAHAAEAHGAVRVERVVVEVGLLQLVVPEALQIAWQACTENTPLSGVPLEIVEIAPRARCRACGADFAPDVDSYACPECSVADPEILQGNDIILKTIECEVPDASPAEGTEA